MANRSRCGHFATDLDRRTHVLLPVSCLCRRADEVTVIGLALRWPRLGAPAHLVIGLLPIVGAASHPSPTRGLGWGLLTALLVGVLPYAWVLHTVRGRRFPSRHIPVPHNQRMLPLAVAAAAAATGLVVLVITGAPQALIALIVAMLAGLAVTAAITRYWKISLPTGVTAGTATILLVVFGPAILTGSVAVAALGWSRIQLGDHSVAQVVAGAVLGATIAGAIFLPVR